MADSITRLHNLLDRSSAYAKKLRAENAELETIIGRLVDGTIQTAWNPDGRWAAGAYPAELVGPHETVLEAITAALKSEATAKDSEAANK